MMTNSQNNLWAGRRFLLAVAMALGLAATGAFGADMPDSLKLERDLQSLSWPRFRTVVEGIPKLRAEVDRHGQFGWQYVRANYRSYPWKKNIDRLDVNQKQELALLIQKARTARTPAPAAPTGEKGQGSR